jgi:hypothetical protein
MLVGDSILAYIREFIAKKKDFEKKLVQLKVTGPPNDIRHAWLYFKYIVTEAQPDGNEFLPEWNWWTNQGRQENEPQSLFVPTMDPALTGRDREPISRTGPPNAGAPGAGLSDSNMANQLGVNSNLPNAPLIGRQAIIKPESAEQAADNAIPFENPGNPNPFPFFNDEDLVNQNGEPVEELPPLPRPHPFSPPSDSEEFPPYPDLGPPYSPPAWQDDFPFNAQSDDEIREEREIKQKRNDNLRAKHQEQSDSLLNRVNTVDPSELVPQAVKLHGQGFESELRAEEEIQNLNSAVRSERQNLNPSIITNEDRLREDHADFRGAVPLTLRELELQKKNRHLKDKLRTIRADSRIAVSTVERERDYYRKSLQDKNTADQAAIGLQKTIVDREKEVENYLRQIGELKETIKTLNTDKTGLRDEIDRKRKDQETKEAQLRLTHEQQLKDKEKEWEDREEDVLERSREMAKEFAELRNLYKEDNTRFNEIIASKEAELTQLVGQLKTTQERLEKAEESARKNFFPNIRNLHTEEKLRRAEEQLYKTTQRIQELEGQLAELRNLVNPNPNENPNPNRIAELERNLEQLRSQLKKEREIPGTLKKLHKEESEKFAQREKELRETLNKVRDRNYQIENELTELKKPGISKEQASTGVQLIGELKKGAEREEELQIQKKKLEEEKGTMKEGQKTQFKKAVEESTQSTQSIYPKIRTVEEGIQQEKRVEKIVSNVNPPPEHVGIIRSLAQGVVSAASNSIGSLLGRQSNELDSTQGTYNKETREFVQSSPSSPPESDQVHQFKGHGSVNPVPTSRAPLPAERSAMDVLLSKDFIELARDQPEQALRIVLMNIENKKLNTSAINEVRMNIRANKLNKTMSPWEIEFLKHLDPVIQDAVNVLHSRKRKSGIGSVPVVPLTSKSPNQNSPPPPKRKKETKQEKEPESEPQPQPQSEPESGSEPENPTPPTLRRSTRVKKEPIKVKEQKETEEEMARMKKGEKKKN